MSFFTAPRLLIALAAAALVLPVAANAAPVASDTQTVSVSTAGLDLARPDSQALLHHRIAVAAHRLCDTVVSGDVLTSPAYADCFGRATADAKAQLDSRIATANTSAMVATIATK